MSFEIENVKNWQPPIMPPVVYQPIFRSYTQAEAAALRRLDHELLNNDAQSRLVRKLARLSFDEGRYREGYDVLHQGRPIATISRPPLQADYIDREVTAEHVEGQLSRVEAARAAWIGHYAADVQVDVQAAITAAKQVVAETMPINEAS